MEGEKDDEGVGKCAHQRLYEIPILWIFMGTNMGNFLFYGYLWITSFYGSSYSTRTIILAVLFLLVVFSNPVAV